MYGGISFILFAIGFLHHHFKLIRRPRDVVSHYCSNCGVECAMYKDPKIEPKKGCLCIPIRYWRRQTISEDHFDGDGLMFHYEDV